MKVFVIPAWHPTERRPLWANWVLPHIDMLRENGHEAYVLQLGLDDEPIAENSDPWYQKPRFVSDNHIYVSVPTPKKQYQHSRIFYGRFLRNYAAQARLMFDMAIEEWGEPDIIHAHVSLPAGFVASLIGQEYDIPVIVQEHYTGFESDARFWWRKGCFVREMGQRIQGLYAVSPGYADRIARTNLLPVTGVLPNPIDTDFFSVERRRGGDTTCRIVTAGNMDKRKGTDLLFDALRELTPKLNWHLTVFGKVSRSAEFSRWLDDPQFSSRLTLPGPVPQDHLRHTYAESDIYVVSSRVETANVSMLQAMSCGVPVVTTACGAPETLIDDSVGISVRPNDPQALSSGIFEAASNLHRYEPDLLSRFVRERYSKPAVAKLVLNAYNSARRSHK